MILLESGSPEAPDPGIRKKISGKARSQLKDIFPSPWMGYAGKVFNLDNASKGAFVMLYELCLSYEKNESWTVEYCRMNPRSAIAGEF
jgi:hypothetical protein